MDCTNAAPMRFFHTLAVGASLLLAAGTAAVAADAVAAGNGGNLALGKNWGPYETFGGRSFRWVANDAEISVRGHGNALVTIVCEGGPSLGESTFNLRVLDTSRRQTDHVTCAGPAHPVQMLLPVSGDETRYVLHVDGGGRRIGKDKRILNFRVFSMDAGGYAGPGGDIVDARNGVRIGAHWYPVEHFKGQTFRWLDSNDGTFFVTSNRDLDTKLRLLVAMGPSIGARTTTLTVRDASGKTLSSTTIADARSKKIELPVHLRPGENEFRLDVQTHDKPAPGDKRLLNLRAFSIAALR